MAPIQGIKRTSLSSTTETPEAPIQGSTIIVIHPGSLNLRIGRASDTLPRVIPHVIAKRHTVGSQIPKHEDQFLVPPIPETAKDRQLVQSLLQTRSSVSNMLQSCITSTGNRRYATLPEHVVGHNNQSQAEIVDSATPFHWTKLKGDEEYLIGEEVLFLNPKEEFNIHWPIRRGQLHIHKGIGGSLTSVMEDLERIWGTAIQKYLDIPLKDLHLYRAVLVIPEIYNRNHVKFMVNVLMNGLQFGSFFVHQEAVCATFGAGVAAACVIDVGDQKTSISCIEDGISNRVSRLSMNYGGSDITIALYWLLRRAGFPYKDCDPRRRTDAVLLNELKETMCHVNLDICGPQRRSFQVRQANRPVIQYTVLLGDECILAPLSLFYPDMLCLTAQRVTHLQMRSQGDPEDPHDDNYLRDTSQKRGNVREPTEVQPSDTSTQVDDPTSGQLDEDLLLDIPDTAEVTKGVKETEKEVPSWDQLVSIDQAILQSIERCPTDDMKRKMYGTILIVGGGMMFQGIQQWMHSKLQPQLPPIYRAEPMDIITRPRETDPRITVWRGASVMSLLDTAQELWISREDWAKLGVRSLRERAPFTW